MKPQANQQLQGALPETEYTVWQREEAIKRLGSASSLFHISRLAGLERKGLRAGQNIKIGGATRPAIWLFTDRTWAADIAFSLDIAEFQLYRIDRGGLAPDRLFWDQVGEFYAVNSFVYAATKIEAAYLEDLGRYTYKAQPWQPTIVKGRISKTKARSLWVPRLRPIALPNVDAGEG